jgi:transposase
MPLLLATALEYNTQNKPVILVFQDEARYGRLSAPRSCWAPLPERPVIKQAIIREFRYIYGSVCPWSGIIHYMFFEQMNTENMNYYLRDLRQSMSNIFIVLVVDGASSHTSDDLDLPKNMYQIQLPPYSPELNPTEQLWRMLKNKFFANRYFETLDEAIKTAERGMKQLAQDRPGIISLTNWSWIQKSNLPVLL